MGPYPLPECYHRDLSVNRKTTASGGSVAVTAVVWPVTTAASPKLGETQRNSVHRRLTGLTSLTYARK